MNIVYKLYGGFTLRVLKKKVVYNYNKYCQKKTGHALLYFKTDVLFFPKLAEEYFHSNNWEVLEKIKILNKLGYWVDIIDRRVNIKKLKLEDKYDIFIGIGAGNSGRYYPDIASKLKKAIKIFYACGLEPDFSDIAMEKRYQYFFQRNPGKKIKKRRIRDKVEIERAMESTDVIFAICNQFGMDTYKKFNKDIYRIYPSTPPRITTDIEQLLSRSQKKFVYLGGNGNIVKGLDLVIETFAELPDLELYICAPAKEKDFNEVYEDVLKKSKNIHFMGFIKVGGRIFNEVTSKCGYVICPSSSEGTPDAIVMSIRKGLVPIVTREAGIDIGNFGFLIEDVKIDSLKSQVKEISKEPKEKFIDRSIQTYLNSFNYTQAGFSESFEKALIKTITKIPACRQAGKI